TPGKLLPTIAETVASDTYVPNGVLAVGPRPGIVLQAKHEYAYVVLRSAKDATGAALGVAPALAAALAGGSDPVAKLYAVLPPALKAAGVDVAQVAAATVFTTGDVVADLAALSSKVLAADPVTITGLAVDSAAGDGNAGDGNARFCELRGQVTF